MSSIVDVAIVNRHRWAYKVLLDVLDSLFSDLQLNDFYPVVRKPHQTVPYLFRYGSVHNI